MKLTTIQRRARLREKHNARPALRTLQLSRAEVVAANIDRVAPLGDAPPDIIDQVMIGAASFFAGMLGAQLGAQALERATKPTIAAERLGVTLGSWLGPKR